MAESPYLSHLFVLVKDSPRTRQLLETIGLRVVYEEEGGSYLRFAGDGGFAMGLESTEGSPGSSPGVEINIWVPNVDETYNKLKAAGCTGLTTPQDTPWGARHTFFQDENGLRFSLFSDKQTQGN